MVHAGKENMMFQIWKNSLGSIEIVQEDMNQLGGGSSFVQGGFETWEAAAEVAWNLPEKEIEMKNEIEMAKEIILKNKDDFYCKFTDEYDDGVLYAGSDDPAYCYLYETCGLGFKDVIGTAIQWLDMTDEERVEDAQKYLDAVEWDRNHLAALLGNDFADDDGDEYTPASAKEMAESIVRAIENAVDDIS